MRFSTHDKKFVVADKIQLFMSYIFQTLLIVFALIDFYKEEWLNGFLIMGIFLLTFLPALLRRSSKVFLPVEFDLLTIGFIFFSLFLGDVHSYYDFWWWDIVLHVSSGLLFGVVGFLLVYILNEEKKIYPKLNPGFVALFSFSFALTMGSLWEVFEFSVDQFLETKMQSGLIDTMWDLIVDALGALVISVLGYFYTRKGDSLLFDRMIHRFVDRNPHLFHRKR